MTHDPRTREQIYEELKGRLTGKITKLTNFTERSFNYVWTQAFARDLREIEMKVVASELSGFVDYSGGPITDDDLDKLGLSDVVDPEDLEPYLNDEQLDQFIRIVGVERLPGSRATGEVTLSVTARDEVTVPKGTVVTTTPEENGDTINFETTEEVTVAAGASTITGVQIRAIEVGPESNVPPNTIVRFADPPIGVKGVDNPQGTTGGEARETNDELRERAKNAVAEKSGGGTVEGIKGFIVSNVEGVREGDVILDEFVDVQPPYVDVIVDGGTENEALEAIESSRPAGIRHHLVRPEVTRIEVQARLSGTDIDEGRVEDNIDEYLLDLGISETFYEDALIRQITTADADILNIERLQTIIQRVTNETFTYDSSVSEYRLNYSHDGEDVTVIDENETTFVEGTDYRLIDSTGDGIEESIEWLSADAPDDGDDFYVDYTVNSRVDTVRDERKRFSGGDTDTRTFDTGQDDYQLTEVPLESTLSVSDESGDTYTLNTDYELVSALGEAERDRFTFTAGRTDYPLSFSTEQSSVEITDASGDTYTTGTDFTVIDADGDGLDDTIRWDTTQATPDSSESFSVTYNKQNGLADTIRWLNNATPDDGENFTATYDTALYDYDNVIIDAPIDQIEDETGTTYVEDTDYEFVDFSADGTNDSVLWIDGATSPSDAQDFFLTYNTEGDMFFTNRQKADPGDITVTVE